MSVRKIGELKRVPIVEGDRNKVSKNTIHIDELSGSKEGSMGYFTLLYSDGSGADDSSTAIVDIATMKEYNMTGRIPEDFKPNISKKEDGSILFMGNIIQYIVIPPTCTVKYGTNEFNLITQDGYMDSGSRNRLYYVKFKNE